MTRRPVAAALVAVAALAGGVLLAPSLLPAAEVKIFLA